MRHIRRRFTSRSPEKSCSWSFPQELEDISSTKIRENIDNHRDISSLIDPVVQEYIYHKGMYLREPEFKPILRAKAIAFENAAGRDREVLDELGNTVLYGHPDAQAILTKIQVENDRLLILRNTVEGERPAGFVSYREIGNEDLFGVLKDMELANLVRGKSSREILLITGIYAREDGTGDSGVIRDARSSFSLKCWRKSWRKTTVSHCLSRSAAQRRKRSCTCWRDRALSVRIWRTRTTSGRSTWSTCMSR
ncbi:MAG: hypothetical protein ACLUAR_09075 [Pilosibacter sp.]